MQPFYGPRPWIRKHIGYKWMLPTGVLSSAQYLRMQSGILVNIARRKHLISRRTGLVHPDKVNDDVMNRWQHDKTSSTKGRWTYRLIPNIEEWTRRKHGQVNLYLTQFLTNY